MERIKDIYLKLLHAKSPFYNERAAADVIIQFLDDHDISWYEDDSAKHTGCTAGNVIIAGPCRARVCFCAHMDTIRLTEDAGFVIEDDMIRANGSGPVGADDKSGVAILLEAAARMQEHGGIREDCHFLFTVDEENGFLGAWNIDERHFKDAFVYVADSAGAPIGYTVTRGVGQYAFNISVKGVMSHSGGANGKNALLAAAEMITELPKEKVCDEVYVNVADITCTGNPNTTPGEVCISGQILFDDREAAEQILEAMKQSVHRVMERYGTEYSFLTDLQCEPFSVADSADIVMHAENAARKAGLSFSTGRTGAGSDAQVFAARGAKAVKIATGMQFVHSCRERVRLTDMEDCVRYVCALAGRYDCL